MQHKYHNATVGKSYRCAIQTKYLPPTNNLGSRIKVWHDSIGSKTYSWDYELDTADNHAKAIDDYLHHMDWDGNWQIGSLPNNTGYIAVWVGE